jgi:ribose 5-phosphate isomerase B
MVADKILMASDHAGLALKNALKKFLYGLDKPVEDLGVHTEDSVDYPDLAHYLAKKIEKGDAARGILVCGTGVGMCMAANRHPGVRAAVLTDIYSAKMSRSHNDSNVLCLGARVVTVELAQELLKVWLDTPFEGGRHSARVKKI